MVPRGRSLPYVQILRRSQRGYAVAGFRRNLLLSSLPSEYGPSLWHTMPHSYCGAERQSPVDIEAQAAVPDESLGAFSFTNFDDKNAIMYIVNTGHSGRFPNVTGRVQLTDVLLLMCLNKDLHNHFKTRLTLKLTGVFED